MADPAPEILDRVRSSPLLEEAVDAAAFVGRVDEVANLLAAAGVVVVAVALEQPS